MNSLGYTEYPLEIIVNGNRISKVRIGAHYLLKHGHYLNDQKILDLVQALDGETFEMDSKTDSISYYAADVMQIDTDSKKRIYRIIWIFEGDAIDVLGVVNAYRRKTKVKKG